MSWSNVLEFNTAGYPVRLNSVEVRSLPSIQGAADSYLHNDGQGNWSWQTITASSSGHVIQDEGTPLAARANLNFVGAGVVATDDAGNNATVVTIAAGGDFVGPAGATNNNLVKFGDASGKLGADSGVLTSDAASAVSLRHAAVTLDVNADAFLSLSTQEIGVDSQAANKFLASPSGGAGVMAPRVIAQADLPSTVTLTDGTRPFTGTVGGITPVASSDLATKEYVDQSVSFIANFYFNNTADALGGIYYKMLEAATGEAESTFSSAALAVGNDQALFNFITAAGVPGVDTLAAGIYSAHIHASSVTVGGRDVKIYFTIVTSDSAGGTQVTRATSEISGTITTKGDLDLHATLAADVNILVTDRIMIKWFANISGGGNNPVVNLFAEGTTSAHLSIPTSVEVLSSVFVRQDGTKPLSAAWDAGSWQIRAETFQSDVATGAAPLVVASTTAVTNLNADTVDGVHGVHAHTDAASGGATLTSPTIVTPTIASFVNAKHDHSNAAGGGALSMRHSFLLMGG